MLTIKTPVIARNMYISFEYTQYLTDKYYQKERSSAIEIIFAQKTYKSNWHGNSKEKRFVLNAVKCYNFYN